MRTPSWARAALDDLRADRSVHLLAALLIGAGAVFRLGHYLSGRSFWIDEAALANNIFHRSFAGLAQPLDYEQATPLGFLLAVKAAALSFGKSELALRLVPLVVGLAALALFYVVALRLTSRGGALVALLLFACAEGPIYYSAELKQYSGDSLAVVALLAIALTRAAPTWRRYLAVALVGAGVLWFSHASLFVLAAITTSYGIAFLAERRRLDLLRSAAASLVWLASLAVFYVVSVRDAAALQERLSYWTRIGRDAHDWFNKVVGHFGYFIGLSESQALVPQLLRVLIAALATIGFLALLRRRPIHAGILGFSGLFFVIAVELELYPLFQRTLFFLIPIVLLLVGHGIAVLAERLPRRAAFATGVALTAAVSAVPVAYAVGDLVTPRRTEEIRPLLGELAAHWRPGDTLYVHWGSQHAVRYYSECDCVEAGDVPPLSLAVPAAVPGQELYSRSLESRPPQIVAGIYAEFPFVRLLAEVDGLRGRERVWILSSHVNGVVEERFLDETLPAHLDRIGVARAVFTRRRGRLWLYDLSRPS